MFSEGGNFREGVNQNIQSDVSFNILMHQEESESFSGQFCLQRMSQERDQDQGRSTPGRVWNM